MAKQKEPAAPAYDPEATYSFKVRRVVESPIGRLRPLDEHEALGAVLAAIAEEDLSDVVRLANAGE